MRRRSISVPLIGGQAARVTAWVDPSNTFAIHHAIWNATMREESWSVTHLRTGLLIATGKTRHAAGLVVDAALASGIDWKQDAPYYEANRDLEAHRAFAKQLTEVRS